MCEGAAARAGERVSTRTIGETAERRPIRAYTVGASGVGPDSARAQVMIIAAIHGCEVIASELALAVLESICDNTDESRPLSEVADLTIIPAINLDSRARSLDSLRRKGFFRSAPRRNSNGVDLNRNWPFPSGVSDHWLPLAGTSRWRSPWYRGPHPFSEPETRAVDALVGEIRPMALLNLHSTGCVLSYPWSSKEEAPPDLEGFQAMIAAFNEAQGDHRYRSTQGRAWYPIVGSSNDYFYDRYGVLSMTVETSPPAGSVKADLRRARRFFWYANPIDPDEWIGKRPSRVLCSATRRVRLPLVAMPYARSSAPPLQRERIPMPDRDS